MNAEVRAIKTAAEQGLANNFAAAKAGLPGHGDVARERETAFGRFETRGLPHRRVEEWKYTDLRALMRDAKPLAGPPDAAAQARAEGAGQLLADIESRRLVFVAGALVPELSDLDDVEPGLVIRSMAEALETGDPLLTAHLGKVVPSEDVAVALNTAFMTGGVLIHVAPDVVIERPLHLVFVNVGDRPSASFTRSLVVIEKGARVMMVESHEGAVGDDVQVNTALEMIVGDGAHVDHIKVTQEGPKTLHLSSLMAAVGAHARFNTFAFTSGGAVVRNQMFLRFDGEGTIAEISGANQLNGLQHFDTTLVADHAKGGCQSREMFKSVLDDESHAVFQGKIIVRQHAQKTDAKLMSRALLLSEDAEAYHKPELEIFADDVQCGHGATAGALDPNLLFSRRAVSRPRRPRR